MITNYVLIFIILAGFGFFSYECRKLRKNLEEIEESVLDINNQIMSINTELIATNVDVSSMSIRLKEIYERSLK